jgi:hypothetical protein
MPVTLRGAISRAGARSEVAASGITSRSTVRLVARLAIAVSVIALYVLGAYQHAERMNGIKSRGDQSAYVQYAKDVYANWHGQSPPIIGDRNRMPLYPAFQSLFYAPSMSDEEFFRTGKTTSIALSVALLLIVWAVSRSTLPPLASVTVTLVAAFTCFVFKAGYFQADLTYSTLHFVVFVASCRLLSLPPGPRAVAMGTLTGAMAALAHLTKAAMLPMVALVIACLLVAPLAGRRAGKHSPAGRYGRATAWRVCSAAALAAAFMLVLWPYLSTSKRVFGQYFYNVNSTFYMWYDEWGDAIKGTRAHGDRIGPPTLPADQLPGPLKYWREHSVGDIGARLAGGFRQIVVDLWSRFWALKFAVLFVALALIAIWPRRTMVPVLARNHLPLVGFVFLYFGAYLTLAAFYAPISGTGVARFTLAMFLPLLLVASVLWHHPAFSDELGARSLRSVHLEWFAIATLALDLPFSILPRLLTTYGGF